MQADIENMASYLLSMGKGAFCKLFFISMVEPKCIVDYGCADGIMLSVIKQFFPNTVLIGYDLDETMLVQDRERVPGVLFTTSWIDVQNALKEVEGEKAIVLSSIIHEVISYCNTKGVDEFWKRVFSFDTVIVRDMMPSRSMDRPSDMTDVINIRRKFTWQVAEFEAIHGSIERNKNLVHFLLKYRWLDNWAREVRENYFPLTIEDFMALIPEGFEAIYWEHFALHYLKNKMLEDTGYPLKDHTHLKCVLRRRK